MSKALRGTKRHCRNCAAKFYDLGRDPIVCPVCQTVYQPDAPSARPAAAAARRAPVVDQVVAPAPAAAAAAAGPEPEFVSLEEVEEPGATPHPVEDEEIVDIEIDEEIPEGEAEDVFLEEEEEDEPDVSGFVGGGPGPTEER